MKRSESMEDIINAVVEKYIPGKSFDELTMEDIDYLNDKAYDDMSLLAALTFLGLLDPDKF